MYLKNRMIVAVKLSELKKGDTAYINSVGGEGALRQHFLDMGVIPGADITLERFAPMGDPVEYIIHGYHLTLRLADAALIEITPVSESQKADKSKEEQDDNWLFDSESEHPGIGEQHDYSAEHYEVKDSPISLALVGNQNSGKTTLFNQLTGANQHVGNFPGVTVEKKTGVIKGHPGVTVTDLPGIYSLSPYSSEEVLSREFIMREKPDAIINIVDASNLERNLYLTMQLMELNVPVVLALNMMDELEKDGISIKINDLEKILQIPVVPISALKNHGVHELVDHAIHIAKFKEKPGRTDFCGKTENKGAVHRCIHSIMHLIEDHAENNDIPVRFAACKLIEGDKLVLEALKLSENEKETIEHLVVQMEEERGLDRAVAMADMRFTFLGRLCKETLTKPVSKDKKDLTSKIDYVLAGKYTALPLFIIIMLVIFWLTFEVIGAYLQDLLAEWIDSFKEFVDAEMAEHGVNETLQSLISNGVIDGVGSVLSFIPIIVVLFLFLSALEDSGYVARIAFVMDRLLRKIGLSGRSIVPLLIGFGCSVPAVMSTRTLPSDRDRRMTIMLIPFMSCTAKVPVYAFFSEAFFPEHGALVMASLYFGGIFCGVITALVSRLKIFKGEAVPFVMELPPYRFPGLKNVLHLMYDKAMDFVERAFTIIFVGTILVWALQNFDFAFNLVENTEDCIVAKISSYFVCIFEPIGLGNWRAITALFSGFLAKESVISTISILYGESQDLLMQQLSTTSCISLLVFCLLYTPCLAAVASIRRECGIKWMLATIVFQCSVAWVVALIVYRIALLCV